MFLVRLAEAEAREPIGIQCLAAVLKDEIDNTVLDGIGMADYMCIYVYSNEGIQYI